MTNVDLTLRENLAWMTLFQDAITAAAKRRRFIMQSAWSRFVTVAAAA
jgi:hypothetical protein